MVTNVCKSHLLQKKKPQLTLAFLINTRVYPQILQQLAFPILAWCEQAISVIACAKPFEVRPKLQESVKSSQTLGESAQQTKAGTSGKMSHQLTLERTRRSLGESDQEARGGRNGTTSASAPIFGPLSGSSRQARAPLPTFRTLIGSFDRSLSCQVNKNAATEPRDSP